MTWQRGLADAAHTRGRGASASDGEHYPRRLREAEASYRARRRTASALAVAQGATELFETEAGRYASRLGRAARAGCAGLWRAARTATATLRRMSHTASPGVHVPPMSDRWLREFECDSAKHEE